MNLQLQEAKILKQKKDAEAALLASLPGLEKEAQREQQAILHEEQKQQAEQMFDTALEAHRKRGEANNSGYNELRRTFRDYIRRAKSDNRSYQIVKNASLSLGYYLASEDKQFELSAESQRAWSQQLLIDNGVQELELPLKVDVLDDIFQTMIEEGLKTI